MRKVIKKLQEEIAKTKVEQGVIMPIPGADKRRRTLRLDGKWNCVGKSSPIPRLIPSVLATLAFPFVLAILLSGKNDRQLHMVIRKGVGQMNMFIDT